MALQPETLKVLFGFWFDCLVFMLLIRPSTKIVKFTVNDVTAHVLVIIIIYIDREHFLA